MKQLIFDIETVGSDFDAFDELTQSELTKRLNREQLGEEAYNLELDDLKNRLGLSPATGEIVAIGMFDTEQEKGMVLYRSPQQTETTHEGTMTYVPYSEPEMLKVFWEKGREYQEFISFFGRGFDAPYLMIRSAIHKIKPSKDIMTGRYLYQQKPDARHIDLYDQLAFYGSFTEGKKSLHMYCQAFGIESPKSSDVTGPTVGQAFREGRYLNIARYNAQDLIATHKLYQIWRTYLHLI